MLSKLILFSAQPRTTKILASLIMIVIIVIGLRQWQLASLAENLTENSVMSATNIPTTSDFLTEAITEREAGFNLSQWTINFVEQLNWQQEGSSGYFQTLLLFVFLSFMTSIGLPRQIAALVAGINLGALAGAIIATLAATLGCLITFSVARYLLSDKIATKYPSKLKKLSNFLGERTFLKAIVIRILPLGSNFLTNIIAGVSKVSMPAYVSGSFVGFIPQMVIFSLAGSGIRLGAQNELIASAILFIIALVITAYLVRKHKTRDTVKDTQN